MAGTPLNAAIQYIPQGTREFVFIPGDGLANYKSPTRAELEAGTNLTGEISDYSGWMLSSDFVAIPNLGNRVISQIPSTITLDSATLVFYASADSDDIRAVLPQDTKGFIVDFPEGDGPSNGGPGTVMSVWPVTVGSNGDAGKMTDPVARTVSFAITAAPAENLTIPDVA